MQLTSKDRLIGQRKVSIKINKFLIHIKSRLTMIMRLLWVMLRIQWMKKVILFLSPVSVWSLSRMQHIKQFSLIQQRVARLKNKREIKSKEVFRDLYQNQQNQYQQIQYRNLNQSQNLYLFLFLNRSPNQNQERRCQ